MHLTCRNVNDAFRGLVQGIHDGTKYPEGSWQQQESGGFPISKEPSRNGSVLRINEPVTITYTHPRERVLFNRARDANPFALLYEALWMLAGRNDVSPLVYYTRQFNEYSDDGKTLNGAYGWRWRQSKTTNQEHALYEGYGLKKGEYVARDEVVSTVDQLDTLINHLKKQPNSRRAVLSMWNVEDDLLRIGPDREDCPIVVTSKDVCCNLNVMFSIRIPEMGYAGDTADIAPCNNKPVLDMTVTNRSNDLVWGLLGANYVTFSILQEYVAAHLGVEVGKYHHFTNNLHVYDWNWKPEEWLADTEPNFYRKEELNGRDDANAERLNVWGKGIENRVPLVHDPKQFDKELKDFVELHKHHKFLDPHHEEVGKLWTKWKEPFFSDVAQPLFASHHWYRGIRDGSRPNEGDVEDALENCQSWDWRIAGEAWMKKREKNYKGVKK